MKKLIGIFLIILGFSAVNLMQATAGYKIVWSGSHSGSAPTNETSRTQQATYEAYMAIFQQVSMPCGGVPEPDWSSGCYSIYLDFDFIECYRDVCISGTWGFSWYVYGGIGCALHPERCNGNGEGGWDVVFDTTTTTIQQTTTTTTAPATLINLSSFTATPKFSKVIIQWSTESEIDNAGFNIYRSESENGDYIKVNDSLILSEGTSTQGAAYEFTDKNVQNRKTYYYKLEDIDLNGISTMHGPVSAMPMLMFGFRD